MEVNSSGTALELYACLASKGYNVSLINVDLPLPLTPLTTINFPNGNFTETFFKLFRKLAFRKGFRGIYEKYSDDKFWISRVEQVVI